MHSDKKFLGTVIPMLSEFWTHDSWLIISVPVPVPRLRLISSCTYHIYMFLGSTFFLAVLFMFPGSNIEYFSLLNVKVPKVHPNIIGPGLAQFPVLNIAGTEMADSQRGTLFFSILDTKKVKILSLERSDLTRVNFVILATAVSSVQRANLSQVRIFLRYNTQ